LPFALTFNICCLWCWLQEFICSCGDIVPSTDDPETFRPPNEAAVYRTLGALLLQYQKMKSANGLDDVTNTTTNNNHASTIDDDDGFVDDSVPLRGIRRTPETLDFNRKRKLASVKFQLPEKEDYDEKQTSSSDDSTLTAEIIEECEYDSDIGKFKCRDEDAMEQDEEEKSESSTSSMVDHYLQIEHLNNLNSPPKCELNSLDSNNIVEDDSRYKIVMKRIEFFESSSIQQHPKISEKEKCEKLTNIEKLPTQDEQTLSIILLLIFILSVTLLIIFPLPN
jgi:hypothetical protein